MMASLVLFSSASQHKVSPPLGSPFPPKGPNEISSRIFFKLIHRKYGWKHAASYTLREASNTFFCFHIWILRLIPLLINRLRPSPGTFRYSFSPVTRFFLGFGRKVGEFWRVVLSSSRYYCSIAIYTMITAPPFFFQIVNHNKPSAAATFWLHRTVDLQGGGNSSICSFHPYLWGKFAPIWRTHIFQMGWFNHPLLLQFQAIW